MANIYFWHSLVGSQELLDKYKDVIDQLLSGNYQSAELDLKQYPHHRIYSVKGDRASRLLFATVMIDGKSCLLLLDEVVNHDYAKSILRLNNSQLAAFLIKQEKKAHIDYKHLKFGAPETAVELSADPNASAAGTAAGARPKPAYFFKEQFISLNDEQQGVLDAKTPAFIFGGPGSGKSCSALALMAKARSKQSEQSAGASAAASAAGTAAGARQIAYLCKNERLKNEMKRTWRSTPELKATERENVVFLTYDDFLKKHAAAETKGKDAVSEEAFCTWYSTIHLAKKRRQMRAVAAGGEIGSGQVSLEPKLLYQECRIIAEYGQQYTQLGRKQTIFNDASEKAMALSAYKAYETYLESETQYDPAFLNLNLPDLYFQIHVDESQDLSLQELKILAKACQNNIIYYSDVRQNVNDCWAHRDLLIQSFSKDGITLSCIGLSRLYRCPQRVIDLANRVKDMQAAVIGGHIDKVGDGHVYACEAYKASEGHLSLFKTIKSAKADERIQRLVRSSTFAVVTTEEHLALARETFDTPLVLTPKQIKGLEFETIVIFKLLDSVAFQQVNRLLAGMSVDDVADFGRRVRLPKDSGDRKKYVPEFNMLFTAITRAQKEVIVVQPTDRSNNNLFTHIESVVTEKVESVATPVPIPGRESAADWKQQATRLYAAGEKDLAFAIVEKQLGGSAEVWEEIQAECQSDDDEAPQAAQAAEGAEATVPTVGRRESELMREVLELLGWHVSTNEKGIKRVLSKVLASDDVRQILFNEQFLSPLAIKDSLMGHLVANPALLSLFNECLHACSKPSDIFLAADLLTLKQIGDSVKSATLLTTLLESKEPASKKLLSLIFFQNPGILRDHKLEDIVSDPFDLYTWFGRDTEFLYWLFVGNEHIAKSWYENALNWVSGMSVCEFHTGFLLDAYSQKIFLFLIDKMPEKFGRVFTCDAFYGTAAYDKAKVKTSYFTLLMSHMRESEEIEDRITSILAKLFFANQKLMTEAKVGELIDPVMVDGRHRYAVFMLLRSYKGLVLFAYMLKHNRVLLEVVRKAPVAGELSTCLGETKMGEAVARACINKHFQIDPGESSAFLLDFHDPWTMIFSPTVIPEVHFLAAVVDERARYLKKLIRRPSKNNFRSLLLHEKASDYLFSVPFDDYPCLMAWVIQKDECLKIFNSLIEEHPSVAKAFCHDNFFKMYVYKQEKQMPMFSQLLRVERGINFLLKIINVAPGFLSFISPESFLFYYYSVQEENSIPGSEYSALLFMMTKPSGRDLLERVISYSPFIAKCINPLELNVPRLVESEAIASMASATEPTTSQLSVTYTMLDFIVSNPDLQLIFIKIIKSYPNLFRGFGGLEKIIPDESHRSYTIQSLQKSQSGKTILRSLALGRTTFQNRPSAFFSPQSGPSGPVMEQLNLTVYDNNIVHCEGVNKTFDSAYDFIARTVAQENPDKNRIKLYLKTLLKFPHEMAMTIFFRTIIEGKGCLMMIIVFCQPTLEALSELMSESPELLEQICSFDNMTSIFKLPKQSKSLSIFLGLLQANLGKSSELNTHLANFLLALLKQPSFTQAMTKEFLFSELPGTYQVLAEMKNLNIFKILYMSDAGTNSLMPMINPNSALCLPHILRLAPGLFSGMTLSEMCIESEDLTSMLGANYPTLLLLIIHCEDAARQFIDVFRKSPKDTTTCMTSGENAHGPLIFLYLLRKYPNEVLSAITQKDMFLSGEQSIFDILVSENSASDDINMEIINSILSMKPSLLENLDPQSFFHRHSKLPTAQFLTLNQSHKQLCIFYKLLDSVEGLRAKLKPHHFPPAALATFQRHHIGLDVLSLLSSERSLAAHVDKSIKSATARHSSRYISLMAQGYEVAYNAWITQFECQANAESDKVTAYFDLFTEASVTTLLSVSATTVETALFKTRVNGEHCFMTAVSKSAEKLDIFTNVIKKKPYLALTLCPGQMSKTFRLDDGRSVRPIVQDLTDSNEGIRFLDAIITANPLFAHQLSPSALFSNPKEKLRMTRKPSDNHEDWPSIRLWKTSDGRALFTKLLQLNPAMADALRPSDFTTLCDTAFGFRVPMGYQGTLLYYLLIENMTDSTLMLHLICSHNESVRSAFNIQSFMASDAVLPSHSHRKEDIRSTLGRYKKGSELAEIIFDQENHSPDNEAPRSLLMS